MKNKKSIVIITVMVLLCVGGLVVGLLIYSSNTKDGEFVPDSTTSIVQSAWEAATSRTSRASSASTSKATPGIESSGTHSTSLTDANTSKPEPPEPPDMGEDNSDPENPPSYTPEQTNPGGGGGANGSPQPGDTRGDGAVYDPVFGWVYPSEGNGQDVDNDGDPNKQVGDM